MKALPGPLEPWAALAESFPGDIAAALVPWMQQLARAIGPLRAHLRVGEGDPDGVDGVTRRAPMDRLLDTERLLATEAPDEFVRRAAQGELLFHALALKELKPPRASLLLVDAGPSQLGAPRLLHLALVLVLAERARAAGARFAWGLLQDPPLDDRPPRLVEGVDPPRPALVILDRRALPPGRDDLASWESFAKRAGWDDLWLVGEAPRPSRVVRGGAVRVRDPVSPGAARLDVEIDLGARVTHRALPLPDPAVQARVLRDPRALFGTKPPAPPPPRAPAGSVRPGDVPAAAPLLLCESRKVVTRNAEGDPLVFAVHTEGLRSRRPRRWYGPPGEKVIAAGWFRRRLVLLTRRGEALLRFDWRGDLFPMHPAALRFADERLREALRERPEGAPLLGLFFIPSSSRSNDALLRLDDGRVLHVAGDGAVTLAHPHALALGEARGRLVMACATRDAPRPALDGVTVACFPANRRAAVIGSAWHLSFVVATRDEGLRWTFERVGGEVVTLLPGDEVLGVRGSGTSVDPFTLVVLDETRHTVWRCGATREVSLRFGEAVLGAAVDSGGQHLAVVSRSGALRVFRLTDLSLRVARGALEVRA